MTPLLNNFDYTTYLSAFTTRYGSPGMRKIWSEENKRLLWRRLWISLAKAEAKAGLVSKEELEDIITHQHDINIALSKERETKVYHELMAEIQVFSESCKIGGGKIHLGTTSTDILDNTTALQIKASLSLVKNNLKKLLRLFSEKMKTYKDTACIGYTHLQPAEPTTLGYRFAFYAQDLLLDLQMLEIVEKTIKGKGLKGAVGTSASFDVLLKNSNVSPGQLEKDFLTELDLDAVEISNQTYPRKLDLLVIEVLANIAASMNKFCFDYRIMQSPLFGEWMEKRNTERVGSSAMPFKRNPDRAEKVCSLCRVVSNFLPLAWDNPANSLLERTLDDSAAQRIFLPEAFLALDDCLENTIILLENLEINMQSVTKNLATYGQFSATESLLMDLVKKGAHRQTMHEKIKELSFLAWTDVQQGKQNPLKTLFIHDKTILSFLSAKDIEAQFNALSHIGLAKERTEKCIKTLQKYLRL